MLKCRNTINPRPRWYKSILMAKSLFVDPCKDRYRDQATTIGRLSYKLADGLSLQHLRTRGCSYNLALTTRTTKAGLLPARKECGR